MLKRTNRAARRRSRSKSQRSRRLAHVEHLENRMLLTVFAVDSLTPGGIQGAVDHAAPGDVIAIQPGIYDESVDLSRMGIAIGGGPGDLTLRGTGDGARIQPSSGRAMYNETPFDGNLTVYGLEFSSASNTGLELDEYHGRLLIINSDFDGNDENGIELSNTTGRVWIVNSDISDMGKKAIRLEAVENVVIYGVEIDGGAVASQDGIFGKNVHNLHIRNSSIHDVGVDAADDGVDLKDTTGTVYIAGNTIERVGDDGIQVEANDAVRANVLILGNRISNNLAGGGIEVRTKDEAVITTTVRDNQLSGLHDHALELALKHSSQMKASVSNNHIRDTDIESAVIIETEGSSLAGASFVNNSISDTNGDGLRVVAKHDSVLNIAIRENELQQIGDDSGDNAIHIQSNTGSGATIEAEVEHNRVSSVQGIGLHVRALGGATYHVTAVGNSFESTNLQSGDAAVLVDDDDAGDETTIHLVLRENAVSDSNGADAYRLVQQDPGSFYISGDEPTPQQIVEDNNKGAPVSVSGTVHAVPLPSNTKFYVVDTYDDGMFEYDADGHLEDHYGLGQGNTKPRGAAANATGDTVWVIDKDHRVYVYNSAGYLLRSWKALGLTRPEGVAMHGNDLWMVDRDTDRVYYFENGANRSDDAGPTSSFPLRAGNNGAQGITTDGQSLWVVNADRIDKVYKYQIDGTYLGNWNLVNGKSRGITIDPSGASNDIWVVDTASDAVYQYANGRDTAGGTLTGRFPLADGNTEPRGIADPPPAGDARNDQAAPAAAANVRALPTARAVAFAHVPHVEAGSRQAMDAALLSVLHEADSSNTEHRAGAAAPRVESADQDRRRLAPDADQPVSHSVDTALDDELFGELDVLKSFE